MSIGIMQFSDSICFRFMLNSFYMVRVSLPETGREASPRPRGDAGPGVQRPRGTLRDHQGASTVG